MSARYDVLSSRTRAPKEPSFFPDRAADEGLAVPVGHAIRRTRQWLLDQQQVDGSWCAELEGDTILESETILVLAFLGKENSPLARRAAAYLICQQLPDGGWAKFPGGKLDISGSVKAYFALKLTGHDAAAEFMERARRAIRAHGGADAVNSFTRFYLALLGQISYEHCPAVPPEMVLLPKWFPVNLYAIERLVADDCRASFHRGRPGTRAYGRSAARHPRVVSQGAGALAAASLSRVARRHRLAELGPFLSRHQPALEVRPAQGLDVRRKRAIEAAKDWVLARFRKSDGLGAIFPPVVFSIVALKALGFADDSPEVVECWRQLERLTIDDLDDGTTRLQPCFSPVWDTGLVMRSLALAGVPADDPAIARAAQWLRGRQTTDTGDWAETVDAEPGGWYFEYANEYFPDVDDTAMSLMALQTLFCEGEETRVEAASAGGRSGLKDTVASIERGLRWMLAMQNRDGGWGAFDRDNDRHFLCYVPFADHNAMIDPSTADLCGRVLEALGKLGRRLGDPQVDRAVEFVRRTQEADGSWFGRWGVNYIYGTWQVLTGLIAVGVPQDDPAVVAGAKWLLAHQQANGGWGESPNSYERPELSGQGPTTASQTGWALLGLIAAGMAGHLAVLRGVRYLTQTQNRDGTWDESQFTGTGFPCVFYLRYHYYPIYFPLMALAQWANHVHNPRIASCVSRSP